VAGVLRDAPYYGKTSMKIVGRRVAKTIPPSRIARSDRFIHPMRDTHRLMQAMPHAAVALTATISRSGSGLSREDSEDISMMLIHLLMGQRRLARMEIPQKGLLGEAFCRAMEDMDTISPQQLRSLDLHFAQTIWGSEDPSAHRLCRMLVGMERIGALADYGIEGLPAGFEAGHCRERTREEPEDGTYHLFDRGHQGPIPPSRRPVIGGR
jgi:hypothetical protein